MANRDTKKVIRIILLSVLFIFIIIYAFFNTRDLIFGVKIRDVEIVSNTETQTNIMNINGTAKNAKNLTLNGREISIDQSGNFNETFTLFSGYNIINLKAEDKFGYQDEKNYQLIGK